MVLSLLVAAATLIRNGSFEETDDQGRAAGWNLPAHFRVEKGVGMNGTCGLAFENPSDKEFYRYPGVSIPFEPGKRYEYSAWIRTEGLLREAMLNVEWFGKDGKWINGSYQRACKGTCDWTLVKGVTAPIPENAGRVNIEVGVLKGALGKAWFDDVKIRVLERPVLGGVYSDVFRNVAADGSVRFHAALNLKEHPGARVVFSYASATEGVVRTEVPAVGLGADLVLEVTALKIGTQDIRCEIVGTDGKIIDAKAVSFTRLEKMPERKTWIDRKGRAIVDGKPFFPLGIYYADLNGKGIDANLLGGPFNCIMPYTCTRKGLDLCQEAGIKVIFSVKDCWTWSKNRPKWVKTDDDADKWAAQCVEKVIDHPALIAWYLNDEISIEKFPQLLKRQRLLERMDPGRPTWTVLYQFGEVRSYYPTFDVIGTDPYPIPGSSIDYVTVQTRTVRDEVMGLKPMWQVPQAFSWGDWKHDPTKRMPTRAEMVNMYWQCVANGANGVVPWAFYMCYRRGEGKRDFDYGRWADICAAAGSLKPFIPIFLSDDEPPVIESGITGKLCVRAWTKGPHSYLAVVNNTRAPLDGVIRLKDFAVASAKVLEGEAEVEVRNGALSVKLPEIGIAFVRIDR